MLPTETYVNRPFFLMKSPFPKRFCITCIRLARKNQKGKNEKNPAFAWRIAVGHLLSKSTLDTFPKRLLEIAKYSIENASTGNTFLHWWKHGIDAAIFNILLPNAESTDPQPLPALSPKPLEHHLKLVNRSYNGAINFKDAKEAAVQTAQLHNFQCAHCDGFGHFPHKCVMYDGYMFENIGVFFNPIWGQKQSLQLAIKESYASSFIQNSREYIFGSNEPLRLKGYISDRICFAICASCAKMPTNVRSFLRTFTSDGKTPLCVPESIEVAIKFVHADLKRRIIRPPPPPSTLLQMAVPNTTDFGHLTPLFITEKIFKPMDIVCRNKNQVIRSFKTPMTFIKGDYRGVSNLVIGARTACNKGAGTYDPSESRWCVQLHDLYAWKLWRAYILTNGSEEQKLYWRRKRFDGFTVGNVEQDFEGTNEEEQLTMPAAQYWSERGIDISQKSIFRSRLTGAQAIRQEEEVQGGEEAEEEQDIAQVKNTLN